MKARLFDIFTQKHLKKEIINDEIANVIFKDIMAKKLRLYLKWLEY